MITVYRRDSGRIVQERLQLSDSIPPDAIWIDLLNPTAEEQRRVSEQVGADLPTFEEMVEILLSARLYEEAGVIYMNASSLAHAESAVPERGPVSYVLAAKHLITQRFIEPRFLQLYVSRCLRQPSLMDSPEEALIGLLESVVERGADVLEFVGNRLDELSRRIFDDGTGGTRMLLGDPEKLRVLLRDVGQNGQLIGKMRDSLSNYQRLAPFLRTVAETRLAKDLKTRLRTVERDIDSLSYQSDFLSQRVAFLLDATLGLVNLQQNNIVRIFSVAAVAFLPPTLIASIYGMNFEFMPELHWRFGYPFALLLMVLSAVLPLGYFKRRGWL